MVKFDGAVKPRSVRACYQDRFGSTDGDLGAAGPACNVPFPKAARFFRMDRITLATVIFFIIIIL